MWDYSTLFALQELDKIGMQLKHQDNRLLSTEPVQQRNICRIYPGCFDRLGLVWKTWGVYRMNNL